VLTGSHSHGQGHETTFAQLVSDRLGIPMDHVAIIHGDTDKVQFGMGTYGSRSGAVGMSAISVALDKVIAKGKQIAAHVLEAAEADIEFKNGKYTVAGTDKSAAFGEIALAAYVAHKFPTAHIEPGLKEHAFYDPTNFTFPAGTHICEVEIDPETGVSKVVRYTTVDDVGIAVNPMLVTGQVHGGVAQGIGQALYEGVAYSEEGQLLTASYQDYCVPRADDIPPIMVTLDDSAPCKTNPLGAKGCGESGAIGGPPCVTNGVMDALSELGIKQLNTPLTPAKVWQAIRDAKVVG
jgi:carbon-monoxide dehydrogenase large subunit